MCIRDRSPDRSLIRVYLTGDRISDAEGQGYEAGMSGFLGGMFLWNLFLCIPPAVVWFGVVLLRLMLSRKKAGVNTVLLFMFSGILGLAWSLIVMVFMGIDGGM